MRNCDINSIFDELAYTITTNIILNERMDTIYHYSIRCRISIQSKVIENIRQLCNNKYNDLYNITQFIMDMIQSGENELMGIFSVTELHLEQFRALLLVVLQKRLVFSGNYVMHRVLITLNYPEKKRVFYLIKVLKKMTR